MTDKLPTEVIRQIIRRWREKPDSEPGWRDWLADEAEAALAAILKRIDELERERQQEFDIATGYHNGREKARDCIEEQDKQIAVMREAIRWARDELFAHGYAQGESARYDKIIKRLESALHPDTGKRVVDVAWLKEVLCAVRLHAIATERADLHELADRIAALIGEGEANDE